MNTSEVKKIWEEVKAELKVLVPEHSFDPWIKPIEALSFEESTFTLLSGEQFGITYIKKNYNKEFLDAFKKVTGKDIIYDINYDENLAKAIKKEKKQLEQKLQKEQIAEVKRQQAIENQGYVETMNINMRYKFENFVVDENNKHAKMAAEKVANNPTGAFNPLYIQGASGLGKTHLMQAIGQHIILQGNHKVKCIKTEDFINDYINSTTNFSNTNSTKRVTTPAMVKFRNKYRNVDILLIDDIQFFENKKKCLDELFNTFDDLYNRNKQIVLTSDKLPKDLPEIPERLRTRFEQGLVVEIEPPKFETRVKILENLAQEKGIENIEDGVFEYIAKYYVNNVRELEGAFTKVDAYSNMDEVPITLEYTKKVLKCESLAKRPNIQKVVETVADYYDVTTEDILSSSRVKAISNARAVASYIAREKLQLQYEKIAEFLNKKHQTITYSVDKTKTEIKKDKNLAKDVSKLLDKLGL